MPDNRVHQRALADILSTNQADEIETLSATSAVEQRRVLRKHAGRATPVTSTTSATSWSNSGAMRVIAGMRR